MGAAYCICCFCSIVLLSRVCVIESKALSMHSQSIADVSWNGILRFSWHHLRTFDVYICLSCSKSFLLPKTKNGKFCGSFGMHLSRKFCRQLFRWSNDSVLVMS